MPWVEFAALFHYRPNPHVWATFHPGERRNVPTACAKGAVAARAAHFVRDEPPIFPAAADETPADSEAKD